MSTFNGIVEEFPLIRIDYFRKNPDRPPPQACFLSHVHSDHLQGLESLRSPFVYCSAATRKILLRIEKYPHRMNFAKGILETRKQEYKHLAKLLRPIPLHVPTEIELTPGSTIRVTLFNANHCPGAVMFLIEGNGKAILYTGDVRAEPWWVESLIRNPILIPYTLGDCRLDRIYLDTTFAIKSDIYSAFPSKAEGIKELLHKVKAYPEDTIFYFRNWTFGYEDVWIALSAALNTKIHVDQYQLKLYQSLALPTSCELAVDEAPYLCGFTLGNSRISGCLTDQIDIKSVRIHSCEPGVVCSTISSRPSVYITPIVTRTQGGLDVLELGAGGGVGDLTQGHDLQFPDASVVERFVSLCSEYIQDSEKRQMIVDAATKAYESNSKSLSLEPFCVKEEDGMTLKNLVAMLCQGSKSSMLPGQSQPRANHLPNTIRFPYSRHSSYDELCSLVSAFRPKDVYPCTVDAGSWTESVSMENLFSHLCLGSIFAHDAEMRAIVKQDESRPRKKVRRNSDASSAAASTQRSNIDASFPQAASSPKSPQALEYPVIVLSSDSEGQNSQPGKGQPAEHLDFATADTDLSFSFPSQITSNLSLSQPDELSTSPGIRIQAIRQALEQKALNNEIDFFLGSSFTDSQAQSQPQGLFSPQYASSNLQHSSFAIPEENLEHAASDPDTQLQLLSDYEDTGDNYPPSSPLSISPSAFDPQDIIEMASDDDNKDNEIDPAQATTLPPSCQDRKASMLRRMHSRISAYRAAKHETWSTLYSLISAGNNHTVMDEEL
ncbi:hypothetical protein DIZ76_015479 [Coccidioides immitis]|nr:hypothetical protein DIZ76_015479 [Coccidioides immitis]